MRLYSAAASDEFDMQIFNARRLCKAVEQKMVSETISKVLYPSDAVAAGRELRLLQEYFFVACAIRDIVRGFLADAARIFMIFLPRWRSSSTIRIPRWRSPS